MANNQSTFTGISQDNPKASKNPWVIGLLSLIVIVLLVNITFITLAYVTNPGLVTENYYEKGQDLEETIIKRATARQSLGWSYSTDFPIQPVIYKNETYRFNIVDKAGVPLSNADVILKAYRPSDATADFIVPMNEPNPGMYEAIVQFPLKGMWDITIKISHGQNDYDFTRRASVVTE
ncbi:MAG: FixH family protein [Gammaproteobacteria bacterium]|nr:FixH family protein [Gammaproteobacteria bacterium]MDH5735238.1 FixH family protein [Gammaproteobacteria bacterium]